MDITSDMEGRITRSSLKKRMNSESENSSRCETPVLMANLTLVTETELLSPLPRARVTRRSSTSSTTPLKTSTGSTTSRGTPKKRAGRNAQIAIEEEESTSSLDSHNVPASAQKQKHPTKLPDTTTRQRKNAGRKSIQKTEEIAPEVDVAEAFEEDAMQIQIKEEPEEPEELSTSKVDENDINSRNVSFTNVGEMYKDSARINDISMRPINSSEKTKNIEPLLKNYEVIEKTKHLRLVLKDLNKSDTNVNLNPEKKLNESPKQALGRLCKSKPKTPTLTNSQINTSRHESNSVVIDKSFVHNDDYLDPNSSENSPQSLLNKQITLGEDFHTTANDEDKNTQNSEIKNSTTITTEALIISRDDNTIPLSENGKNDNDSSNSVLRKSLECNQSVQDLSEQPSHNVTVVDVDSVKNKVDNIHPLSSIESDLMEYEEKPPIKNASLLLSKKGGNNTSLNNSQGYADFIQSPLKDKKKKIEGKNGEKQELSDQSSIVPEQSSPNVIGGEAHSTQSENERTQQPMSALNNLLECKHEQSITNISVLLEKKGEDNTPLNKSQESVDSLQISSEEENINKKKSASLDNSNKQSSRNVNVVQVDSAQNENRNMEELILFENVCKQEQCMKNASALLGKKDENCKSPTNSQESVDSIQSSPKTKRSSANSTLNEECTAGNVHNDCVREDDEKKSSIEILNKNDGRKNDFNKSISRNQTLQNQSLGNLNEQSAHNVIDDDIDSIYNEDENTHPLLLVEEDLMECEEEQSMSNVSVLLKKQDRNSTLLNKSHVSVNSTQSTPKNKGRIVKNSTFKEENTVEDRQSECQEEEKEGLTHQTTIIQWIEKSVLKQASHNEKELDIIDINVYDDEKKLDNKISHNISNEKMNSPVYKTGSPITVFKNYSNELDNIIEDNNKNKTNFFEVEASEVENYESGDSMKSDEYQDMLLNEIPVDYDDIDNDTTVEEEAVDNEEEEFDSFIDDNSDSANDDLKKYKRIKPMYSSDDSKSINESFKGHINDPDNQIIGEKFKCSDEITKDGVEEKQHLRKTNSFTNEYKESDAEATSKFKLKIVQLNAINIQGNTLNTSNEENTDVGQSFSKIPSSVGCMNKEHTKKKGNEKLSVSFSGRTKAVKRMRQSSLSVTIGDGEGNHFVDQNQIDNNDKKRNTLKMNANSNNSPESNQFNAPTIDINKKQKNHKIVKLNDKDINKIPEQPTVSTTLDAAAKGEKVDTKSVEQNSDEKIKKILNRCTEILANSKLHKVEAKDQYKKDKKQMNKVKKEKPTGKGQLSTKDGVLGENGQKVTTQEPKSTNCNKRARMESSSDGTVNYKSNERNMKRLPDNIITALAKQNIKEKHKVLKKVSVSECEKGGQKKVFKTYNAAGVVVETSLTPVRKPKVKTIKTSSGLVLVEPLSPSKLTVDPQSKKRRIPVKDVSASESEQFKKRRILKQTNAAGIVFERSPTPIKKEKCKTIKTLLGPVLVEPITPKDIPDKKGHKRLMDLSNSKSEEPKGKVLKTVNAAGPVVETSPTPFKKRKILNKSHEYNSKMLSKNSKSTKRNRGQVNHSATDVTKLDTLPKPQWNRAGFYTEELLEEHVIQNTAATKFLVRSLQEQRKIKKSNMDICKQQKSNFKQNAQKRTDIKRTSAREIVQRKIARIQTRL